MIYLFKIHVFSEVFFFMDFPFFFEIQNTFSKNLLVPISQFVCFGKYQMRGQRFVWADL